MNLSDIQTKILFDAFVTYCYKKVFPNRGWFYRSGNYSSSSQRALQNKGYIDYMGYLTDPEGLSVAQDMFSIQDVIEILSPEIEKSLLYSELLYLGQKLVREYVEDELNKVAYFNGSGLYSDIIGVFFEVTTSVATAQVHYQYNVDDSNVEYEVYDIDALNDEEASRIKSEADVVVEKMNRFMSSAVADAHRRAKEGAAAKLKNL